MAIPYRGEMFMGDPVAIDPLSAYLQFRVGSTLLPYVSGTAFAFSGNLDGELAFVPDGHCWPVTESVPGAGLIGNGILTLTGTTHVRIYARVSCDDWVSE